MKRFHLAQRPLKFKKNKKYKQQKTLKPEGFWYAIDNAWIEWCRSEMPEWEHEYLYEIILGPKTNLLYISNYKELIEFTNDYQVKTPEPFIGRCVNYNINWPLVAFKYDGIEINPYIYEARFKLLWYYGWDVASGCIWNLRDVTMQGIDKEAY